MTLAELRRSTRFLLRDPYPERYANVDVDEQINLAALEMATRARPIVATIQVALQASVAEYPLAPYAEAQGEARAIVFPLRVGLVDGDGQELPPLTFLPGLGPTPNPAESAWATHWYRAAQSSWTVGVYPTPNAAGGTLQVACLVVPAILSADGDAFSWAAATLEAGIPYGAAAFLLMESKSKQDLARCSACLVEFDKACKRMGGEQARGATPQRRFQPL